MAVYKLQRELKNKISIGITAKENWRQVYSQFKSKIITSKYELSSVPCTKVVIDLTLYFIAAKATSKTIKYKAWYLQGANKSAA